MDSVHDVCKVIFIALMVAAVVGLLVRPGIARWRSRQEARTAARVLNVQRVLVWVGAYLFGAAWITDALVTGETSLKRVSVTRAGEPFLFWLIVAMFAVPMVVVPMVLILERRKSSAPASTGVSRGAR